MKYLLFIILISIAGVTAFFSNPENESGENNAMLENVTNGGISEISAGDKDALQDIPEREEARNNRPPSPVVVTDLTKLEKLPASSDPVATLSDEFDQHDLRLLSDLSRKGLPADERIKRILAVKRSHGSSADVRKAIDDEYPLLADLPTKAALVQWHQQQFPSSKRTGITTRSPLLSKPVGEYPK